MLPRCLHRLILTALNPSIDSHQSLHLCDLDHASLGLAIAATATVTDLADLSFQHQLLSWTSGILRPLLTSLLCLTSISLKDTGLHGDYYRELSLLSTLRQLDTLDVSHNCLHDSFEALSCTLAALPSLRCLNLAKTVSFMSDLHPLAHSIRLLPRLETFTVGGVDLFRWHRPGRTIDSPLRESLLALMESLPSVHTLRNLEVVFARLRLSQAQLVHLSRSLGRLTALQRVRVSTSGFSPRMGPWDAARDGFDIAMQRALPQLSALTILDIGFDAALYGGVRIIAAALPAMCGLQELRLCGAAVRDEVEACEFAAACAALPCLSCLELTCGEFAVSSPEQSLSLVAQLARVSSLRSLRAPLVIGPGPVCKEQVLVISAAMPRCRLRLDAMFVIDGEAQVHVRPRLIELGPVLAAVAAVCARGPRSAGITARSADAVAIVGSLPLMPAVAKLALRSRSGGDVPLLQLLRGCGCLRQLRSLELDLYEGLVGEEGPRDRSEGMAEAVSSLHELTHLWLSGSVDLSGNAVMAGCAKLNNLQSLCLHWGRRHGDTLHIEALLSLRTLQLWNAELPDEGVFCKEVKRLPCLRALCVNVCSPAWDTAEVKLRLQASVPHLHLLGSHF